MYDQTGNRLIIAILIGMVFGVISVALFGTAMLPVKFLGDIFLNALKMVVIPLLFCSIVVGITNLGDIRKLGRTGFKTISYFLVTSSIAVAIGIILVNLFQPGVGVSTFGSAGIDADVSYSFFDWLAAQIPSNIIEAAAETKVLAIIIFALIFGSVLTTLGPKGKPVIAIFDGVNEAIMKIVRLIMWFAPIGIFGLIAGQLAAEGGLSKFSELLTALGKYSLVVILGLLLHAVIVLPTILKFLAGKNPIEYLIGMSQALTTAFATASSSATLPVSMDCVENKNDIDKRASSFVLPLGATINMDGTALYEAVAAIFIAQAYGIDLNVLQQITIFATAILASIGAAGIPEAGLVTMVLVLQAVGLPLEGIGLILAIDWFLDRCRTTVNVWGDSIGAAVIATTSEIGLIDRRQKKTPPTSRKRTFKSRQEERRSRSRRSESREQPVAQQKKEGLVKRIMNRRQRDKRDRPQKEKPRRASTGKRPIILENRAATGRFKTGEAREEYKPEQSRERPKPEIKPHREISSKPSDTSASSKPEDSYQRKSDRGKPPYGRRQAHHRSSRHSKTESAKQEVASNKPEADQHVSDSTVLKESADFRVPKFPDKIFKELIEDKIEREKLGVSEIDSKIGVGEDDAGAGNLDKEVGGDTVNQAADEKEDSKKDFSRLDQMVLGEKEDNGTEISGADMTKSDVDSETIKEASQSSSVLPRPADDWGDKPDEMTDEKSHEHEQKEAVPPEDQKEDSINHPEESDFLKQEEKPDDQVEEAKDHPAAGEKTTDEDQDDTDETQIKYGRSKHRRPSR